MSSEEDQTSRVAGAGKRRKMRSQKPAGVGGMGQITRGLGGWGESGLHSPCEAGAELP